MFQKYSIPKSTLYKILNDEKAGKIPSFNMWCKIDSLNHLNPYEKEYIIKAITPPQYPITIEKLDQSLSNKFGERNRKRQI